MWRRRLTISFYMASSTGNKFNVVLYDVTTGTTIADSGVVGVEFEWRGGVAEFHRGDSFLRCEHRLGDAAMEVHAQRLGPVAHLLLQQPGRQLAFLDLRYHPHRPA
jgi:hypothetical protein